MPGRQYTSIAYRYGFSDKENDNELKGTGNSIDFGDRIDDSRLGKWLSLDKYFTKYPYQSPYSFAANSPVSVKDVRGDSLYIMFHTTGNTHDDGMFEAAALTRQKDIQNSECFDPKNDKVVVLAIQDIYTIKEKVEATVAENREVYGPTAEVGIWSHAGPVNGPVGTALTSKYEKDKQQMTDEGWSTINFNWASNAKMAFYGCRTGIIQNGDNADVPKDRASFATVISALPNFKDVRVFGQTASGFASVYTNYRDNKGRGNNDFILGRTSDGRITFSRTYMVGGIRLRHNYFMPSDKAFPMSMSKNGTGKVDDVQPGTQKKE